MTLVEIRERRVHFLRHIARTLELSLDIRRTRIEDAPDDPFDIALIRAVAPPLEAIPLARPWTTLSGEIWIWTSESPASLPWPASAQIPLARGSILRIPARAVPHGTA
jgi:16S rRNA G527 N7-methylase RsmG